MHRFSHCIALALAAVALAGAVDPAAVAGAQVTRADWPSVSSLRPGDTVRVWASAPPLSGRAGVVAGVGSDTLALSNLPGRRSFADGLAVPFRTLTRIEVQRGQRRSAGWTVAGVVLGLAGGAIIGSYSGVLLECGGSCSDEQGDLNGLLGFVIGGGLGAIAGGVTGGIIGAQRRPRWEPVALPAR